MDALDGNAIAGTLMVVFGHEMTMATGTCAHCAKVSLLAEMVVYLQAPGKVARCPTCDSVVMVVSEIRGVNCVDLRGLAALDAPH
jgi:phage FluMu protein Com